LDLFLDEEVYFNKRLWKGKFKYISVGKLIVVRVIHLYQNMRPKHAAETSDSV